MIQSVFDHAVTAKVGTDLAFRHVPIAISVIGSRLLEDGTLLDWPDLRARINDRFGDAVLETVDFEGVEFPATPETLAMALWEGVESYIRSRAVSDSPRMACSSVQVTIGGHSAVYAPSED